MKLTSKRVPRYWLVAGALVAYMGALSGPASALTFDPIQGVDLNRPRTNNTVQELEQLRNRQDRQRFQDTQRLYREQDRQQAAPPLVHQRPDVPSLQPRCSESVFGSTFLKRCR
ncbi:hypothetical protein QBK99_06000 [Corticibacterium sp. UT-5YL-CI-8]|nr:hypothetical protein [Tianweitania sp. UT-5YL-CI-8]